MFLDAQNWSSSRPAQIQTCSSLLEGLSHPGHLAAHLTSDLRSGPEVTLHSVSLGTSVCQMCTYMYNHIQSIHICILLYIYTIIYIYSLLDCIYYYIFDCRDIILYTRIMGIVCGPSPIFGSAAEPLVRIPAVARGLDQIMVAINVQRQNGECSTNQFLVDKCWK